MSSNFSVFRRAARSIESGWLCGDWSDDKGNKCLVQGVLNSTPSFRRLRSRILPSDIMTEIDSEMSLLGSYRFLRKFAQRLQQTQPDWYAKFTDRLGAKNMAPEQLAMIMWNDTPWRRKEEVVGVLSHVADRTELAWRTSEIARLRIRVAILEAQKKTLVKELARIKEENKSLRKRLANRVTLRETTDSLQQLSDELDARWRDLQAVS